MLDGVKAMGYAEPTPIQLRAIPLVLSGKDVIGSAQTGTGKTAAFALPILSKLGRHNPVGPRALILEPTRELASQVETAIRDYARFTDLKVTVVYGGVGYGKQNDELRAGADIVVATPGRLLDHLEQGTLRLDKVEFLVLDEADRMLDMGFLPDVRRLVEKCPRKRHTALFSATIPPQIETLIQWAMHNPETIEIGARRTPAETVKHVIYPVSDMQKTDLLLELLEARELQFRAGFLPHEARRRPRRRPAQAQRTTPWPCCIPTARRRNASRRWKVFAKANTRCSSPRTSPRAAGHRRREPRHQLRRAAASGGLHPPHRPHRPRGAHAATPSPSWWPRMRRMFLPSNVSSARKFRA